MIKEMKAIVVAKMKPIEVLGTKVIANEGDHTYGDQGYMHFWR